MKMTYFNDVMDKLSADEQEEIDKMAYEMYLDWRIQNICEEIELSSGQLANGKSISF